MQAIVTKYLGPTNSRGARVKAICDAGSLTIPWDHALNSEANHKKVATALAWKYGWLDHSQLVGGGMPSSLPYAYCFVMVRKGIILD